MLFFFNKLLEIWKTNQLRVAKNFGIFYFFEKEMFFI